MKHQHRTEPLTTNLPDSRQRPPDAGALAALAPMPTFIDFEASSLDLICSYPIEVGVCLADGSLHSWLIRPAPLWDDWSATAQAIHGIAREQLLDEGVEVPEVAACLNECLQDIAYSDAWTFDSFWLHRLFRAARLAPRFGLDSVSQILTPPQIEAWPKCRQQAIHHFGLTTHRAANDARILHETWKLVHEGRSA